MTAKYLAFDIETAKDIPGEDFNWRPHRPLGICCAATFPSDASTPQLWFSKTKKGDPAKQLSEKDAKHLVEHLGAMAAKGYKILTWNGLAFDFDILAEESGSAARCQEYALAHVDLMFHLVCALGYPVAMDKAAEGLGLEGKPAGMTGADAPRLWAQGKQQQVLDYVAQDVQIALKIARTCESRRHFAWITRKGTKKTLPLPTGWLTVQGALRLPQPDTSWMASPLSRREFTAWLASS